MSPSSTILTKQSDECVFKFTEQTLKSSAISPYSGGNTFLKFVRSKVDSDLVIAGERQATVSSKKGKKITYQFLQGEDDKIYSTIPGIPRINKEIKKHVPGSESVVIMEYTDREYLVF